MIGTWQLVLIFVIVLVLFGAGRIPTIMRDLGVGFRAFKDGINNDQEEVDYKSNHNLNQKTLSDKSTKQQATIKKKKTTRNRKEKK